MKCVVVRSCVIVALKSVCQTSSLTVLSLMSLFRKVDFKVDLRFWYSRPPLRESLPEMTRVQSILCRQDFRNLSEVISRKLDLSYCCNFRSDNF